MEKIDYDFSKYKNKKASSVGVALRASHFDNVNIEEVINVSTFISSTDISS